MTSYHARRIGRPHAGVFGATGPDGSGATEATRIHRGLARYENTPYGMIIYPLGTSKMSCIRIAERDEMYIFYSNYGHGSQIPCGRPR